MLEWAGSGHPKGESKTRLYIGMIQFNFNMRERCSDIHMMCYRVEIARIHTVLAICELMSEIFYQNDVPANIQSSKLPVAVPGLGRPRPMKVVV